MTRRKLTKYEKLRNIHFSNYVGYSTVMKQQISYLLKLLMVEKGFNKQEAKEITHAVIDPHWYKHDAEDDWGHHGYFDTGPCHYQNGWLRNATPEQIRRKYLKPSIVWGGVTPIC